MSHQWPSWKRLYRAIHCVSFHIIISMSYPIFNLCIFYIALISILFNLCISCIISTSSGTTSRSGTSSGTTSRTRTSSRTCSSSSSTSRSSSRTRTSSSSTSRSRTSCDLQLHCDAVRLSADVCAIVCVVISLTILFNHNCLNYLKHVT